MIVPVATSVSAGYVLATAIERTTWHVWRDALAIGALAGLYPAVRASRLPPTEALSGA